MRNIRHFWDTGINFNAFLDEIEVGHVAALTVKNLRRFLSANPT